MDVVVAQGLLENTCLLKLSTASRHTVTRAARHNAMKNQMETKKKEVDRQLKSFAEDTMLQLAAIQIYTLEECQCTALNIMMRICHRRVTREDALDLLDESRAQQRRREEEYEPEGV